MNFSLGTRRGFSLVELVIVLGVMIVASFFVIPFLYKVGSFGATSDKIETTTNQVTGKPETVIHVGSDAAVQAYLSNVQFQSKFDYKAQSPNSYGPAVQFTQVATPFTGTGAGGTKDTALFGTGPSGDEAVTQMLNAAWESGGNMYYATNGTSYFIAEKQQEDNYWCIDSTGAAKVETETPTADGDGTTFTCSQQ